MQVVAKKNENNAFFVHEYEELNRILHYWVREFPAYDIPSVSDLCYGEDPYSSYIFRLMIDEVATDYQVSNQIDEESAYHQANSCVQDFYFEMIDDVLHDICQYLNERQFFYTFVTYNEDEDEQDWRSASRNVPIKEVW